MRLYPPPKSSSSITTVLIANPRTFASIPTLASISRVLQASVSQPARALFNRNASLVINGKVPILNPRECGNTRIYVVLGCILIL